MKGIGIGLLISLLLMGMLGTCLTANILTIFPFPSRSHGILVEKLLLELTKKGHQVTHLTGTVPTKPLGLAKIIAIPDMRHVVIKDNKLVKGEDNMLNLYGVSPWVASLFIPTLGPKLSEHLLKLQQVQELINSTQRFDLIFGELFLDESVLAGLSHRFQAPIAVLHLTMPNVWSNYAVGNPQPTAYIPDPFTAYTPKMTFLQRANNFLLCTVVDLYHRFIILPQHDTIMRTFFGEQAPPIHDLLRNTSLVLVNNNAILSFPRPKVPNLIEIGGMHVEEPNPLPKELQDFMDNARDGVILFSMGSNVKSELMPEHTLKGILKAFSRMKQNVLWKFGAEIKDLPKNVRLSNWLPQADILAHPNLKLFITHGGMGSTTEAAVRGVPVLGIPIFADQPINMMSTVNAGFGQLLEYSNLNEETFYKSVMEVMENPRYKQRALEISKLLKDQPQSALESAVWWLEYVIRHKGAYHLRSAGQDLLWYQENQLDVVAVLIAILLLLLVFIRILVKTALKFIFGRAPTTTKKIKRN